jgi:hypothetical protein
MVTVEGMHGAVRPAGKIAVDAMPTTAPSEHLAHAQRAQQSPGGLVNSGHGESPRAI